MPAKRDGVAGKTVVAFDPRSSESHTISRTDANNKERTMKDNNGK